MITSWPVWTGGTHIERGINTDLKKLEPILILSIATAPTIINTIAINTTINTSPSTPNLSATTTSTITTSGPSCS